MEFNVNNVDFLYQKHILSAKNQLRTNDGYKIIKNVASLKLFAPITCTRFHCCVNIQRKKIDNNQFKV
jgi:hypothetical protein